MILDLIRFLLDCIHYPVYVVLIPLCLHFWFLIAIPSFVRWDGFQVATTTITQQLNSEYITSSDSSTVILAVMCIYAYVLSDLIVGLALAFDGSTGARLRQGFFDLKRMVPGYVVPIYLIKSNVSVHAWESTAMVHLLSIVFFLWPLCHKGTKNPGRVIQAAHYLIIVLYRAVLCWAFILVVLPSVSIALFNTGGLVTDNPIKIAPVNVSHCLK